MTEVPGDTDRARAAVESVEDPELVDVTIGDLGVVRDVRIERGTVHVEVTPTYTACPAWELICDDIRTSLSFAGFDEVEIVRRLSPPWNSDMMTDRGRLRLARSGIAPPQARHDTSVLIPMTEIGHRPPSCVACGSTAVEIVSWFGSSACKSLSRCTTCAETFESFKTLHATGADA